jgi:hypothetical protein
MRLGVALTMFPNVVSACQSGAALSICASLSALQATAASDPAVRALFSIAAAEQNKNLSSVIQLMREAKDTRNGSDPALGAAFALALFNGGEDFRNQSAAAGLETDIAKLQRRALEAYPYSPGYWTDVGDTGAAGYNYHVAYALYEVAASLPVDGARAAPSVVSVRRDTVANLRGVLSIFFLPQQR